MTPLDHALALAAENLMVFPCNPKTKAPLTARGFKDATTNESIITAWWQRRPDALVGVPTGRLLVVDVDLPDGRSWFEQHALRLAYGRAHRTRRGGWHLIYMNVNPPIECSASKIAKGIDVRGTGGYVIWWPCVGLDSSGDLVDVSAPPDWLVDVLRGKCCVSATFDRPDYAQLSQGATEGARNATLAKITGHLLRRGVDARVVRELGLAWSQARCNPPMNPEEAMTTIKSIVVADLRRRTNGRA